MAPIRLSRGHLRCLAAMERGGRWVTLIMTILPILINLVWTIIYFQERTVDVFQQGPCNIVNGSHAKVYATPFFLTNRTEELWATQTVFALITAFVWAPYRYLRPRSTRNWFRLLFVLMVDFVTLFPFLLSLIFIPAYLSYVPTFLRVWIAKYEVLSLLSPDRKIQYLVSYLALDILSITISVIGTFEWSVNNFPVDPINYGDRLSLQGPKYPCLTFLDSVYWFLVTFATVGYGDIVPTNLIARGFVVFWIVMFLLMLPQFVNQATTIVSSYGDLKAAKFEKSKSRDYIVMDGRITSRIGLQALTVLQPKFFVNERFVSYIVVLSDIDDFEGLKTLRDFRVEEYTRLFLMQGSLDLEQDATRASASSAKAVYVLPVSVNHIPYPTGHHDRKLPLAAATEQTREFCMKRDFDTIRRIWAAQLSVRDAPIRTLLMHKANANLIDYSMLDKHSPACRCTSVKFMFADAFDQRVGAAGAIIPAFGTVLVNLMIGGSCAHKSFDEYEAEATDLEAIDKIYAAGSRGITANLVPQSADSLCKQSSFRSLHATPNDEQYVRSLRSAVLLVVFKCTSALPLGRICKLAFRARVLVLATIPAAKLCRHENCKVENIVSSYQALVRPDDFLICFGGAHQIDIIRRSAFWQHSAMKETAEVGGNRAVPSALGVVVGQDSSAAAPVPQVVTGLQPPGRNEDRRRSFLREGEHDHVQSAQYLTAAKHELEHVHLRDTRHDSEIDDDEKSSASGENEDEAATAPQGSVASLLPKRVQMQLKGHIIVSSSSHDDYVYFVRKLRSRDLVDTSTPILLLDSKPPNKFRWSEISRFNQVYFMQGRAFVIDDLKRAGFENASCLILLTDLRASYEQSAENGSPLMVDKDNLLAEKVASRLKRELECPTRIVTHVACEASCEFVGVERMRKIAFDKGDKSESLADITRRKAFGELSTMFQQAWSPITYSSYITGETWSPACFLLAMFAVEAKGGWNSSFFEYLTDTAGTLHGLVLEDVPLSCHTYEQAVTEKLKSETGLVIGIFKGLKDEQRYHFRGVLLFPENDFPLCSRDQLYVMRMEATATV